MILADPLSFPPEPCQNSISSQQNLLAEFWIFAEDIGDTQRTSLEQANISSSVDINPNFHSYARNIKIQAVLKFAGLFIIPIAPCQGQT